MKAFTLVEVLAIVIIIGLISIFAVTSIVNLVGNKELEISSTFEEILYEANNLYVNQNNLEYTLTNGNVYCTTINKLVENNLLQSPVIDPVTNEELDGLLFVETSVIDGKYNYKLKEECTPVSSEPVEEYVCDENNQLFGLPIAINDSLTPVKIDADGNLTKVSTTNTNGEWHNYCESNWANAVILNDGVTKNDGESIDIETEVKQMYVYIPRYKYEVFASSEPITINVEFQSVTEITGAEIALSTDPSTLTNTWITHPAFYYEENGSRVDLPGIWVGKFENGFKDGEDENTANVEYVIKPNLNSVHNTNIATMYDKINDETIPNQIDVHMMKNMEWGAVAYLSQANYGICETAHNTACGLKIENNNYYNSSTKDIVTGCGGDDTAMPTSNTGINICPVNNRWNTMNGIKTSSTHNITGVYDMAGGGFDIMMALGEHSPQNSGFSSLPESKYCDYYELGDSSTDYEKGLLGDGTKEMLPTSNRTWNNDYANFPYSTIAWFSRGYHAIYASTSGSFSFGINQGSQSSGHSSRSSLWILN